MRREHYNLSPVERQHVNKERKEEKRRKVKNNFSRFFFQIKEEIKMFYSPKSMKVLGVCGSSGT